MADTRPGNNLPSFRSTQLAFAAHIRNPEVHERPADVEPRRMQIYLDLFYNNIERFLAETFPVAKRVLGERLWHVLARRFVHEHPSESPYFLDISQEFLAFLADRQPEQAPDYLLELCHYEWVELSLKVDERELPEAGVDPAGDLAAFPVVLNPLLWSLQYRYPVPHIRPGAVPTAAPPAPTLVLVYRDRSDRVRFRELSTAAFALVQQLAQEPPVAGAVLLTQLWAQRRAEAGPADDRETFEAAGLDLLETLREAEVVLGTALPTIAAVDPV
ncbi:MAG: putative DNA-binding domain-containing protein [Pseudomonadota bacterium]